MNRSLWCTRVWPSTHLELHAELVVQAVLIHDQHHISLQGPASDRAITRHTDHTTQSLFVSPLSIVLVQLLLLPWHDASCASRPSTAAGRALLQHGVHQPQTPAQPPRASGNVRIGAHPQRFNGMQQQLIAEAIYVAHRVDDHAGSRHIWRCLSTAVQHSRQAAHLVAVQRVLLIRGDVAKKVDQRRLLD